MSLLGPFDRPVALRLFGDGQRSPPRSTVGHPVLAPIEFARAGPHATSADCDVARFLTKTLFADAGTVGAAVAELEAAVDERVVTWSPALYTTSRNELIAALLESDDAVSDIDVSIDGEGVGGPNSYVLWSLTGRFDNVGFLNDDVLVEPSHATIASAGVLVFTFEGHRVVRIDCFYDGVSLLEQVLHDTGSREARPEPAPVQRSDRW